MATSVSVVIPAYREADGITETIGAVVAALQSVDIAYEIIVVDDGSPDDTYRRVQLLAATSSRIRGLRLSRNFGKEAALLAGLQEARGDAVITMDADGQHPPALIPRMVAAWRDGAKVVHAEKRDRGDSGYAARLRATIFNGLLRWLGGVDVRNASDFKLLDRCAVDALTRLLPERSRFYRGLAYWIGFAQVSVPFDVAQRRTGRSSWSLASLVRLAVTALLSFTSAPLRIITVLGVLGLILGSIIAADAVWSWAHGNAVSGFATIILTLLWLGGFIMMSLGIIGEYIGKIYDEIKGRPAYLIEARCGPADPAHGPQEHP